MPFQILSKKQCFQWQRFGMLGNIEALPTQEEVAIFVKENFDIKAVLSADDDLKIYQKAKAYLNQQDVLSAWKVLLASTISKK